MLLNSAKVLIPEGTRVLRQKNNTYVYHVINKTYLPEKKYYLYHKVCIGKKMDDQYMVPNENYLQYYSDDTLIEENTPVFSYAIKTGGPLVIWKVLKDLKLDELIDSIYGEHSLLIKDLIAYVIINESSVMQHYPDYAWEHLIQDKKIRTDNEISALFKDVMNAYDNELFLIAWNKVNQKEDEKIYISYDSTNINTVAQGVELAEFGYAKDDDNLPQVNLSYGCKHSDATPLYYEMYPGSIVDNYQMKYMIDKSLDYGYKNIGFILDRGYFSKGNIRYLRENNCDYIMMVKLNSQILKGVLNEVSLTLKLNAENYISRQRVYGVTKKIKLFKDELSSYAHIYYDNERASQEVNSYLERIEKIEEELETRLENSKLLRESDLKRYSGIFEIYYDTAGYYKSHKKKTKEIQKQCDEKGYFILLSSEGMNAKEALRIYRDRDSIEKLFRNLKSGMGYSSFNVHTTQSVESKTHLVFIANIVRNEIFQKIKSIKGNDRKSYTVPAVINQLEKIMVIKNHHNKYTRMYGLTAKQKKILECFGIDNHYINEAVSILNKTLVI